MMRFLPCYQAVESMRQGMSPGAAGRDALARIKEFYPSFTGALVVVSTDGEHDAACSAGMGASWSYSYRSADMDQHATRTVECV